MLLFGNTQAKVKINRTLSNTFNVDTAVFQGDGLSPTPFTAYLEAALRHILQVSESGVPFDDLEYADDVNFIHRSPKALQQAKEHLKEWGLTACLHWHPVPGQHGTDSGTVPGSGAGPRLHC